MGEMFIPSRVRERLLEALTELEDEIVEEIQVQAEEDDPDAGPYSEDDARNEVQHHVERLTELIDGKTAWCSTPPPIPGLHGFLTRKGSSLS